LFHLKILKEMSEKNIKCRAIACGGDGTILWVIK
jgi:hypothetical protein